MDTRTLLEHVHVYLDVVCVSLYVVCSMSTYQACGQLAAGTCEIVTLDRDSSQPRRTIARQTARCACRKGQIAGTTRARPACVDGKSHSPGSTLGAENGIPRGGCEGRVSALTWPLPRMSHQGLELRPLVLPA
ncbi:PREDICTED: protein FAM19A4-like, partial [Galeopterus variegatus]|uniref:Protein FAM19A4-like n=1 Tax=Galeopterus variegatus TaxID=482537 RepID=A0ABM0S129_GALVR